MWTRKTPEQIATEFKERWWRRFDPRLPVAIGLILGGLLMLFRWLGWHGKDVPWGEPVPFTEALPTLPGVCLIAFAATYLPKILGLDWLEEPPVVICNRCFQVQSRNGLECCACGGEFEPLHDWKWNEDERKSG